MRKKPRYDGHHLEFNEKIYFKQMKDRIHFLSTLDLIEGLMALNAEYYRRYREPYPIFEPTKSI